MNKNIIPRRAGAITVCVITICLLALSALYITGNRASGLCGYTPLVVLSDSMYPTIKTGDLLIIRNMTDQIPETGDIIAFYDGSGTIITHRIVDVIYDEDGSPSYITQGDGNNSPDRDAVQPEHIIGTMCTGIGGVGRVIWTIRDMLPWICAASAVAAVVCAVSGRRPEKEYEDI